MKTLFVAAVSMATGAAVGYALCHATVTYLRRSLRSIRLQLRGGATKKKMGVMDKVLILEAVLLIAYTVADLVVFWHTSGEPTTLTACVFGVCGLENGVMGWIKTNKDKSVDPSGSDANTQAAPPPERPEPPDVGQ